MQVQTQNPSLRLKALQFLQDQHTSESRQDTIQNSFQAYRNERDYIGKLLTNDQGPHLILNQSSFQHYEKEINKGKQFQKKPRSINDKHYTQSNRESVSFDQDQNTFITKIILNKRSHHSGIEEAPRQKDRLRNQTNSHAYHYRDFMKLKAYTEAIQRNPNKGLITDLPVNERLFRWNMNGLDRNENIDLLKQQPKTEKYHKQLLDKQSLNLPSIGYYKPDFSKIHPKSPINIFIKKNDTLKPEKNNQLSSIPQVSPERTMIQSRGTKKKSKKVVDSYISEVFQMYSNLQSQIQREVKVSIQESPQNQHPYNKISVSPLSPEFVADFQEEYLSKLKYSLQLRSKIVDGLKKIYND